MVRTLSALALALLPAHALAHGDEKAPAFTLVAPVDGNDDVPTNTLVWLDAGTAADDATLRLRSTDGDDITLSITSELTTTIAHIHVWQPERELLPDTRYVLWSCTESDCDAQLAEFVTRSGPATEDPPPPAPTTLTELDHVLHTDAEFDGLLVVSGTPAELDADARSGDITAIGLPGEPITFQAHSSINSIHLGTYDLAGNFSGFSGPHTIILDKSSPCDACNLSDDPPGALLLVLAALGVARRRRRP